MVALAVLAALLSACASTGSGSAASTTVPAATATVPSTTTTTLAPTTAPSTSTTTTTTTTLPGTAGAPAGLTLETGDLQSGVKGLRTYRLQAALKALKFDPGPLDGHFGLMTEQAVWAYQALYGFPVNGVLNTLEEASILVAKPAPMLRPDLGPTHTEVDLDKQILMVFRNNALVLITHVSTGSGRHFCNKGDCGVAITPTGDFHYQRRISGWRVAPLGELFNPIYFDGGIAVHGEPSVPLYPASHGCVRIPMHIADYFPSLVNNGDAIAVFHGGPGRAHPAPVAPPTGNTPAPSNLLAGA